MKLDKDKRIKPVLKWVGGKAAIADCVLDAFPKSYGTYYEPFLGGGAIALSLHRTKRKVLGDINQDLINFYQVLKDKPDLLIEQLIKGENHFNEPSVDNQSYFSKVRGIDRLDNWRSHYTEIDQAARIIFLNRTCFNGLWRVNSRGENNSPYGYPDYLKFDIDNLKKVSFFLRHNVEISLGSYQDTCSTATKGDLVYLDPPYDVIESKKAIAYDSIPFCQLKLKDYVDDLSRRGCYVVLSNAATPLILELYKDYHIKPINARRSIAANGDRTLAKEVIVTNF